jgi:DNA polymerase I-like protein with 3'-5' exonuclease and polymerase domains
MKFKVPPVITWDYETDKIMPRPDYPPKPLGAAIQWPGERWGTYHAWGHASANNCTWADGRKLAHKAWTMARRGEAKLLFQNGKFDIDVAETFFEVPRLSWDAYEDTMFLIFLKDPHARRLGLKEAAQRILGVKPEEQDEMKEWLISKRLVAKNVSDKKVKEMMQLIPGDIVGRYAAGDKRRGWLGDTGRTLKLFQLLLPEIHMRGMMDAYNRERRLQPHLLDNERDGVRVDQPRLERDMEQIYYPALKRVEQYIFKRLGGEINLDSDEALANALEAGGLADGFLTTATGKRSVSAESLNGAITDKPLFLALGYRSRLCTAKNTFMEPWLREASRSKGRVHGSWRQIASAGQGENKGGAKTGRAIMAEPNLLNLIKSWKGRGAHGWFYYAEDAKKAKVNTSVETTLKALKLPMLPLVRVYMLPEKGELWGRRDFNQQELRILGHFEDGAIMQGYLDQPTMDIHQYVIDIINEAVGIDLTREHGKTLNFAVIYGRGIGKIAEELGISYEEAKKLRAAQLTALPGLKDLESGIKELGRSGECIVTWGGREYFSEDPVIINNFVKRFDYRLLNYICQGSAADCTKETLIRWLDLKRESKFCVTVYDEIDFSAPKGAMKKEMALLRDVIHSIEFDVPMLSDAEVGPNWGTLEKYKEPKFDMDAWLAYHGKVAA